MYKMLQLFLPELYQDKAAQTQKPYAILIPLLMVDKEAIGSVFCFRHLTHTWLLSLTQANLELFPHIRT